LSVSQTAAAAFLLLLALVPAALLALAVRRSGLSAFQCFLWGLAYLLCKFLWRARWLDPLPLAAGQGAIIACNHRSSVDPFFIQTATLRKVHWMVAREYCQHRALGWFLRVCEVIPVGRGGVDTAATKQAIRLGTGGEIVGMLPEGRINMSEQFMLPVRPGVALVALRARVPIVPCYIEGAPYRRYTWSPFLMPARVTIRFGAPIDLSEFYDQPANHEVLEKATGRILKGIAALAGRDDFEPQFAGRQWKPTDAELEQAMNESDRRRQENRRDANAVQDAPKPT
jgi:1-acyl-sn-glycerol-3-phosphate acyltransferase